MAPQYFHDLDGDVVFTPKAVGGKAKGGGGGGRRKGKAKSVESSRTTKTAQRSSQSKPTCYSARHVRAQLEKASQAESREAAKKC